MQIIDSGNFQAEIEKTLLGLGFLRTDFDRQCSEFSGGWRMRVELAKILLQCPDVILLDEPTNHLDIESIQWLENFLANTSSAILLVSHAHASWRGGHRLHYRPGRLCRNRQPFARFRQRGAAPGDHALRGACVRVAGKHPAREEF